MVDIVAAYRTKDGSVFATSVEAVEHEIATLITGLLNEGIDGMAFHRRFLNREVAVQLAKHADRLREILKVA